MTAAEGKTSGLPLTHFGIAGTGSGLQIAIQASLPMCKKGLKFLAKCHSILLLLSSSGTAILRVCEVTRSKIAEEHACGSEMTCLYGPKAYTLTEFREINYFSVLSMGVHPRVQFVSQPTWAHPVVHYWRPTSIGKCCLVHGSCWLSFPSSSVVLFPFFRFMQMVTKESCAIKLSG